MLPRALVVAIFAVLVTLFASKFAPFQRLFSLSSIRAQTTPMSAVSVDKTSSIGNSMTSQLFDTSKPKTPVFFFSHGGPTFMYPEEAFGDAGAYNTIKKLGKYIKDVIKPNFLIVVSAHWEAHGGIEIGVPAGTVFGKKQMENDLIYDFYGFPDYMYQTQFHTRNDVSLAEDIKKSLNDGGVSAKLSNRGLDHGVWVPFHVAFATNKNKGEYWDLDVPLVQVSLAKTDDFVIHRQLGQVLAKYREMGGVVICSGMSVHNLRDMRMSMQTGKPLPYVAPFNELLLSVVSQNGDDRFAGLQSLKTTHNNLLRKAHPTLEHFMPIVVAAGAAEEEQGKELYANAQLSLGWGVYQFGEYNETKL